MVDPQNTKKRLIPRLGGLHTAMNFFEGDWPAHERNQVLPMCGFESNILGPNSTEHAMAGKAYNKAMRAHKLTFQAIWRLLLPQFLPFLQEKDVELHETVTTAWKSKTGYIQTSS